jgi:osmoprotectant transport system ATP-binding protein
MVTHDVGEAIELGDRICIMDKGKIVQVGSAKELLFNPVNEFVSSFLQEDRLRFVLEATLIKDVWEYLPAATSAEGKEIPVDNNLWKTLEMLSLTPKQKNTVHISRINSEARVIDTTSLMSAFSQSKNSLY